MSEENHTEEPCSAESGRADILCNENTCNPNPEVHRKNPPGAAFFFALSFLSRIRCPMVIPDQGVWRRSFYCYPLVGMILGFLGAVIPVLVMKLAGEFQGLILFFAVFYVGMLEWLTRFLHLDGFCDCCDAFCCMAADAEKRLAVMKDSHIGAAAAGGTALLIAAKTLAVYLLFMRLALFGDYLILILILVFTPALARYSMICCAVKSVYPRKNGTAKYVVGNIPAGACWILGLILAAAVFILFGILGTFRQFIPVLNGWNAFATGVETVSRILQAQPELWKEVCRYGVFSFLMTLIGCFAPVVYWQRKANAKIGGITGDVLGAVCETAELTLLVTFLAVADRLTLF